mgnify:FL=1
MSDYRRLISYIYEYEGKENSLRLRLPQPSQHSDKAEMADSIDC